MELIPVDAETTQRDFVVGLDKNGNSFSFPASELKDLPVKMHDGYEINIRIVAHGIFVRDERGPSANAEEDKRLAVEALTNMLRSHTRADLDPDFKTVRVVEGSWWGRLALQNFPPIPWTGPFLSRKEAEETLAGMVTASLEEMKRDNPDLKYEISKIRLGDGPINLPPPLANWLGCTCSPSLWP